METRVEDRRQGTAGLTGRLAGLGLSNASGQQHDQK
jgi:hypothetical protein